MTPHLLSQSVSVFVEEDEEEMIVLLTAYLRLSLPLSLSC